MNKQLLYMMAEAESWESAIEFGIPRNLWADYKVNNRLDDLYISLLSNVFSHFRNTELYENDEDTNLSSIAKTLLIYSGSSASKYISGVESNLNLLYCASCFYIAGYPASATLVAKRIASFDEFLKEEIFLYNFFIKNKEDDIYNEYSTG